MNDLIKLIFMWVLFGIGIVAFIIVARENGKIQGMIDICHNMNQTIIKTYNNIYKCDYPIGSVNEQNLNFPSVNITIGDLR